MDLIAGHCLFVGTLPFDFALLRGKRKYIKSKTTAKLNGKQTSIATGLRPIPNVCHLPDPPWFSLQTSFKILDYYEEIL
jgi:hypothetical protein